MKRMTGAGIIACVLAVTTEGTEPWIHDAGGGFVFNHGAVFPAISGLTFTNQGVRDLTISVGQLSGVCPETGEVIADPFNLLPLRVQSIESAGDVVAGGTLYGDASGLWSIPAGALAGTLPSTAVPGELAEASQAAMSAFSWGDHAEAGYLRWESDPAWHAGTNALWSAMRRVEATLYPEPGTLRVKASDSYFVQLNDAVFIEDGEHNGYPKFRSGDHIAWATVDGVYVISSQPGTDLPSVGFISSPTELIAHIGGAQHTLVPVSTTGGRSTWVKPGTDITIVFQSAWGGGYWVYRQPNSLGSFDEWVTHSSRLIPPKTGWYGPESLVLDYAVDVDSSYFGVGWGYSGLTASLFWNRPVQETIDLYEDRLEVLERLGDHRQAGYLTPDMDLPQLVQMQAALDQEKSINRPHRASLHITASGERPRLNGSILYEEGELNGRPMYAGNGYAVWSTPDGVYVLTASRNATGENVLEHERPFPDAFVRIPDSVKVQGTGTSADGVYARNGMFSSRPLWSKPGWVLAYNYSWVDMGWELYDEIYVIAEYVSMTEGFLPPPTWPFAVTLDRSSVLEGTYSGIGQYSGSIDITWHASVTDQRFHALESMGDHRETGYLTEEIDPAWHAGTNALWQAIAAATPQDLSSTADPEFNSVSVAGLTLNGMPISNWSQIDSGSGADQPLNTTSDVTFASVTADIYYIQPRGDLSMGSFTNGVPHQ